LKEVHHFAGIGKMMGMWRHQLGAVTGMMGG
jgi:hypothetical protein